MKNIKNKNIKEKLMLKNLKDAKKILDEEGVEYWLDYGTLLGAMREGKIIEWDCDIDFGTFNYNWEKIFSTLYKFKEKGFRIKPIRNMQVDGKIFYRKILLSRYEYDIDIAFYHLKDENFIDPWMNPRGLFSKILNIAYYLFSDTSLINSLKNNFRMNILRISKQCIHLFPSRLKTFISCRIYEAYKKRCDIEIVIVPAHFFKKLKNYKFYKMDFKIPSNTDIYLERKYGRDWKMSQKEWRGYGDTLKIR